LSCIIIFKQIEIEYDPRTSQISAGAASAILPRGDWHAPAGAAPMGVSTLRPAQFRIT
jgi:hypothetical protein